MFDGLEGVEAVFERERDRSTFSLTAKSQGPWSLSQAWDNLIPDFLADLRFENVTLSLEAGAGKKNTLELQGTLAFDDTWGDLSWFLPEGTGLEFSGAIDMDGPVPVFELSASLSNALSLDRLGNIDLDLVLACGNGNPGGEVPFGVLELGLASTITIGKSKVPIFVDLAGGARVLVIEADTREISDTVLEDLGEFAGQNLGSILPSQDLTGFDLAAALRLDQLFFTFIPSKLRVADATFVFSVTPGKKWTLWDGVDVTDIAVSLTADFTAGKNEEPLYGSIEGYVEWGSGKLDIRAALPDCTFFAELVDGSTVPLSTLLNTFLPSQAEIDADITLYDLDLMMAPRRKSFAMTVGLEGTWPIDLGFETIELERAWAEIEYGGGSDGVGGTINARARIGDLELEPQWTLPGDFSLTGRIDDVSLDGLARKLLDFDPPDGFPAVALEDIEARIETGRGAGGKGASRSFGFSVSGKASVDGNDVGAFVFEIVKQGRNKQFLVVFEIAATWTPADLWSELGAVFDGMKITNAGLAIASGDSMQAASSGADVPGLPAGLGKGVTFFAEIDLDCDNLRILEALFPGGATLAFLAVIDPVNPLGALVTAEMTGKDTSETGEGVTFTGLAITVDPARDAYALALGADLNMSDARLKLEGRCELHPKKGEVVGAISLVGAWENPFGFENLTIEEFGLAIGAEKGMINVGCLGKVTIGEGEQAFDFTLGGQIKNLQVPDVIVFELDKSSKASTKPLMLPTLIRDFTTLDASDVPVLEDVGFHEFDFCMVANPGGWTNPATKHHFPPGVALNGDLTFKHWVGEFDLEIGIESGIKASGSINDPIDIEGVLVISSADGKKGPSAMIDTSALGSDQRILGFDGYMSLLNLGIEEEIKAEAKGKGFEFESKLVFMGRKITTTCALEDARNFYLKARDVIRLKVVVGKIMVPGTDLVAVPRIDFGGYKTDLDLEIRVNPTEIFLLTARFSLVFGGQALDFSIDLTAEEIGHDLSDLDRAIGKKINDTRQEIMHGIVGDFDKWLSIAERGIFNKGSAKDVVKAYKAFGKAGDDAARKAKEWGAAGWDAVGDFLDDINPF